MRILPNAAALKAEAQDLKVSNEMQRANNCNIGHHLQHHHRGATVTRKPKRQSL